MTVTTVERTLELRLHERDTATPADGTVDFTLAHSRFITVPSWGGQIVRHIDARTESRPYWVDVLDVDGELTAFLDVSGRLAILGRLAELRISTDGGAFARVDMRRVSNIRGGSEGAYSIELSDERWIEQGSQLFETSTSVQFYPAGLESAWMDQPARGNGRFGVEDVATDYLAVFVLSGATGREGGATTLTPELRATLQGDLLDAPTITGAFTSLRFDDGSADRDVVRFDPDLEAIRLNGVASQLRGLGPMGLLFQGEVSFWEAVLIYWPSHGKSTGDHISGRFHWSTGIPVSEDTPVLLGGLDGIRAPDLWEDIAAGDHGGPAQQVDSAAFTALAGDTYPRAWYRLTASAPRNKWVEDNLAKPYTVVPFVDAQGRLAPRSLRTPLGVDPDTLFTFDHTNVIPGSLRWRAPSSEAITQVEMKYFARIQGLIFWAPRCRTRDGDTIVNLGLRQTKIETEAIFRYQDHEGVFDAVTSDILERYQDAPQTGELESLIETTSPVPGDLVLLDHTELHGPNLNTGARSGNRVVQIMERQRSYQGTAASYRYTFLDTGPNDQPLAAPTVSIAQTAGDTKHSVDITLTDVVAGATARVEVAHGASPPAADWVVVQTGVGNETIVIGQRPSNTQINARATASAPTKIRSDYSTEDDVTTAALTAPSSVVATATNRDVKVTCTLGETDYEVQYTLDGDTVITLPAGSAQFTMVALAASTLFTFGCRHIDEFGGVSSLATDTETTGTSGTAPTLFVLWLERRVLTPAQAQLGVTPAVIVHMVSGDRNFGIAIERAPDDTGSPDTANSRRIAQLTSENIGPLNPVPGGPVVNFNIAVGQGTYTDPRPLVDATYWYRALHVRDGWTDGTPTAWVSITLDDLIDVDPVALASFRVNVPFGGFEESPGNPLDKTNGDARPGSAVAGIGNTSFALAPGVNALKRMRIRAFTGDGVNNGRVTVTIFESIDGTETSKAVLSRIDDLGTWTTKESAPLHVDFADGGALRIQLDMIGADFDEEDARLLWLDLDFIAAIQ